MSQGICSEDKTMERYTRVSETIKLGELAKEVNARPELRRSLEKFKEYGRKSEVVQRQIEKEYGIGVHKHENQY